MFKQEFLYPIFNYLYMYYVIIKSIEILRDIWPRFVPLQEKKTWGEEEAPYSHN